MSILVPSLALVSSRESCTEGESRGRIEMVLMDESFKFTKKKIYLRMLFTSISFVCTYASISTIGDDYKL